MWCLALLEIMVANPTNMNCFMQVCVNLSTTLTWPPEAKLFCLHMQSYLIQRHHKKFSCSFRGKNPDLSDLMTFYIIAIGHSSFTSCSVCWCSPMPHQLLCEVSAMSHSRHMKLQGIMLRPTATLGGEVWLASFTLVLLHSCRWQVGVLIIRITMLDWSCSLISFQFSWRFWYHFLLQISSFTKLSTIVPLLPCFEAATPILFGASPPASLSSLPGLSTSFLKKLKWVNMIGLELVTDYKTETACATWTFYNQLCYCVLGPSTTSIPWSCRSK